MERVRHSSVFQELEEMIAGLAEQTQKDLLPKSLIWEDYFKDRRERHERGSFVEMYREKPAAVYQVSNVFAKQERLIVDDYGRELNERFVEQLTHDIYLQETYQILFDQITLTKKP
jgi:hypothetical protein